MTDQIKKSFNIPADLNRRWDDMHPSRKDHSVSGTAAILLWLTLEDYPGLREQLRKLGQGPINAGTIKKAKEALVYTLLLRAIQERVQERYGNSAEEILSKLVQSGDQLFGDKKENG
jgi:hypothetical protein